MPKDVARRLLLAAEHDHIEAFNRRDTLLFARLVSDTLTFVLDTMLPGTKTSLKEFLASAPHESLQATMERAYLRGNIGVATGVIERRGKNALGTEPVH